MRAIAARLDRLERARGGDGWQLEAPYDEAAQARLHAKLAANMAGAGYDTTGADTMHALGRLLSDDDKRALLAELKTRAAAYEASHEWRWMRGKCYVRAT